MERNGEILVLFKHFIEKEIKDFSIPLRFTRNDKMNVPRGTIFGNNNKTKIS